jgi:hypothetical protein
LRDGAGDAPTVGLWEIGERGEAAGLGPDHAADPAAATYVQPETDVHPSAEFETLAAPADMTELPAGDTELDLGRASLEAGDPDEAAVRLGIALRVAPALAPAVLDVVAGRTERSLVLVRGDAYRLVGREIEAQRAYAEAARGAAFSPPTADDHASAPDPSDQPDDATLDPSDDSTDDPSEGDPA